MTILQGKREKDLLEAKFNSITQEVKKHNEIKNVILNEHVVLLQSQLEQKVLLYIFSLTRLNTSRIVGTSPSRTT